MTQKLTLTGTLNISRLPIAHSLRLVYLLLEVGGSVGAAGLPINLSLVVDVSESMYFRLVPESQFGELARQGLLREALVDGVQAWESSGVPQDVLDSLPRKIDRVKDALRIAVEHLRPVDKFSLIAFARHAVTLIPSTWGSDKRRLLESISELDQLHVGDETYVGRGMLRGLDELTQGGEPGSADRMLVLTDGFTQDEGACREAAVKARLAHIPVSTMGLGGDFNEELMIPIADQTAGEAYLLEDPDDIPAAFVKELQRVQTICRHGLEIKLKPAKGVEVRAAYRVRPTIVPLDVVNDDGSYSFPLGDLVAGEEPALLLEMIIPPRQPGVYRLTEALLAYDDLTGALVESKTRTDVLIECVSNPTRTVSQEPRVMHIVEALSAYKLQQLAQVELASGNVTGATRKLRAASARLSDMGEETLAAEVRQQANALEQQGQADSRLTKRLRYETRRLTQKI
jgi:hypothetical protein